MAKKETKETINYEKVRFYKSILKKVLMIVGVSCMCLAYISFNFTFVALICMLSYVIVDD